MRETEATVGRVLVAASLWGGAAAVFITGIFEGVTFDFAVLEIDFGFNEGDGSRNKLSSFPDESTTEIWGKSV